MTVHDVAIIGAGPAGLSAAIQLKRYGVTPLVFEGDAVGGLLRNANLVENYPGFPGGIPGIELIRIFRQHAAEIGVEITHLRVKQLDWDGDTFRIETSDDKFRARVVVVATGTKPRHFTDFPIPPGASDRVLYEVHHLFDRTGLEIAIVGAGDAAFDYALNLVGRGNRVTILNRGTERKCLPLLWERVQPVAEIQYLENAAIQSVMDVGDRKLLLDVGFRQGSLESMEVDVLIGAIGREPQLDFLSEAISSEILTLAESGILHIIGDVNNGIYRQTSIAVGDGVRAAMQVYRYLEEKVV